MWFGNKRLNHSPSERTVQTRNKHGATSDRSGYSLGIMDANKLVIPRPKTWSPTSSFVFNSGSGSNTSPQSNVSLYHFKFLFTS